MRVDGMKKSLFQKAAAVFLVTLAAFSFLVMVGEPVGEAPASGRFSTFRTVVIDPGHGGADGGAVGYSGSVEKGLNLDISLKLRDLLRCSGFRVVMIREDDRSIHEEGVEGIAAQKRSDLHRRLAIYNEDPTALVVSVHMNRYGDPACNGAQIFYSPNLPASKELAGNLQSAFVRRLQPENRREIKPAEERLFLLFHAKVPAVLCECGFLSNPEEEALLLEDDYRSKVAFTLFEGLLDYLI